MPGGSRLRPPGRPPLSGLARFRGESPESEDIAFHLHRACCERLRGAATASGEGPGGGHPSAAPCPSPGAPQGWAEIFGGMLPTACIPGVTPLAHRPLFSAGFSSFTGRGGPSHFSLRGWGVFKRRGMQPARLPGGKVWAEQDLYSPPLPPASPPRLGWPKVRAAGNVTLS